MPNTVPEMKPSDTQAQARRRLLWAKLAFTPSSLPDELGVALIDNRLRSIALVDSGNSQARLDYFVADGRVIWNVPRSYFES